MVTIDKMEHKDWTNMQKIQKLNNLPSSSFFFKSVSENQIINNTCPYINYNGEPKGRPS